MSYLYNEYYLVSHVPSLVNQWEIQAIEVLKNKPENILIIGPGFGYEINSIINKLNADDSHLKLIEWLDLDREYAGKGIQTEKIPPSIIVRRIKPDNLMELDEDNRWDCIVCSFVLHDIKYENQKDAISILYKALKPGGTVLISEMFLDNRVRSEYVEDLERKKEIDVLYNGFYDEVQKEISGETVGKMKFLKELLKIKDGSRNGTRDYFFSAQQTIDLLSRIGFAVNTDLGYIKNEVNFYLGIIIARRRE